MSNKSFGPLRVRDGESPLYYEFSTQDEVKQDVSRNFIASVYVNPTHTENYLTSNIIPGTYLTDDA